MLHKKTKTVNDSAQIPRQHIYMWIGHNSHLPYRNQSSSVRLALGLPIPESRCKRPLQDHWDSMNEFLPSSIPVVPTKDTQQRLGNSQLK